MDAWASSLAQLSKAAAWVNERTSDEPGTSIMRTIAVDHPEWHVRNVLVMKINVHQRQADGKTKAIPAVGFFNNVETRWVPINPETCPAEIVVLLQKYHVHTNLTGCSTDASSTCPFLIMHH